MQQIYFDFINSGIIVFFLSTEIKLESFVHLFFSKWVIYLLYRICHPNLKPVFFSRRYYYDKDILAKIQGKRYAYQFNFKALSLACQAQQTPTPSDAKLEDLSTILAPLLNPATSSTSVKNGETFWCFNSISKPFCFSFSNDVNTQH